MKKGKKLKEIEKIFELDWKRGIRQISALNGAVKDAKSVVLTIEGLSLRLIVYLIIITLPDYLINT